MNLSNIATAIANSVGVSPLALASNAVTGFDRMVDGLRHRECVFSLRCSGGVAYPGPDSREEMELTVVVAHAWESYTSIAAYQGERAEDAKLIRERIITNQPGRDDGVQVWSFVGESVDDRREHSAMTTLTFVGDVETPNQAMLEA